MMLPRYPALIQSLSLCKKILFSNWGRLEHPFKLTYVVTKECHSRCVNCKIWRTQPSNELTLDEVSRFAERNPHWSWIDFTGGEPTDRPDFVQVVETFLRHCPDLLLIHFPTNGLKPERIEEVVAQIKGLNPPHFVITVSIDGPPRTNDRLRGVRGDFDLAMNTFGRLRKILGKRVFVGLTLYPENVSLIDETFEAIRIRVPDFTYRDFHINTPNRSSHFYQNENAKNEGKWNDSGFKDQILSALKRYQAQRGFPLGPFEWVEKLYQRQIPRYLETGKTPISCSALMSSCFLAENGEVFPCLSWGRVLGNIRETDYSLKPILKSSQCGSARAEIVRGDCPHCWTPCEAYPSIGANLARLR